MVVAIADAAAGGERDFVRPQQHAIDVLNPRLAVMAVDRRRQIRLVHNVEDGRETPPRVTWRNDSR
jgi:hypothetical protein